MKLQLILTVAALSSLIWIQPGVCDGLSNASGRSNWTCACSFPYEGNQSYVTSNCSTSCACSPAGGTNGRAWTCSCSANGFPKVNANIHDATCFTSCNCTSGSLAFDASQPSGSRSSLKVVVIVLLLCVVFTTIALVASLTFYMYRKEKSAIESSVFSSDKEASCNSTARLISRKVSSVSGSTVTINYPVNNITGCFGKAFFCWSKAEIIHGSITRFLYSDLECATDKFSDSNLIGLGGSSNVFCGLLKDGRTVAVKRLIPQGGPDADSLFYTEVEVLSRLHHCHVVPLLGYCSEFQGKHCERLLVFEYMPNGNLRDCLDGIIGEAMTWETRITIAIGAARGLEYLHEAAAPRILHRDVKSTNILLDDSWRAKITDLGMAKRLRGDDSPSCSSSPARMQGTFGYFAPEYAMVGRASLMSDVFSFGVVLLELITGRHPIQKVTGKGEESLVLWATPRLLDSRRVIDELPDPHLKGNFQDEELQIMAYLAKECLLLDPDARPTMSEVVQILSTIAPDKSRRGKIPVNIFQMSSQTAPFIGQNGNRADHSADVGIVSTEYMEGRILLTTEAQSWREADEEAVDLTEPRFESFHMEDTKSP